MKVRFIYLLCIAFLPFYANSQVITGFDNSPENKAITKSIPDSTDLDNYYDSLYNVHKVKLLTGYIASIYHEPSQNISIEYSMNGQSLKKTHSDSLGRYFIVFPDKSIEELRIKITHKEFYVFDTVISAPFIPKRHIIIMLSPRYNILLRGRVFVGTLPSENIDVQVIHDKDTTGLRTLGCFTDDENYWNCLYRGMFKHSIIFEDPEDTVLIYIHKPGFESQSVRMKVSEYDGTIIPIKLPYSDYLPKFPRHNLAIKYSPPISKVWSVSADYTHMLNLGNFNRIGVGFESKMLITEIETQTNTFFNLGSADTSRIISLNDSTYNSGLFTPHVSFWLTNPERRFYSLYAGLGFPFIIPENKFHIQPYFGGRFYLDINKALLLELNYTTYELDIVNYEFNPYGKATKSTTRESFNRIMLNLGLQVSF